MRFDKEFLGQWHMRILRPSNGELYAVWNVGFFNEFELKGSIVFNTTANDGPSFYSYFSLLINPNGELHSENAGYFKFNPERIEWESISEGVIVPRVTIEIMHQGDRGYKNFSGKVFIGEDTFCVEGKKEGVFDIADPLTLDWKAFKWWVEERRERGFIYRGQTNDWPLRTSFHRTKRSDLILYQNQDLHELQHYVNALNYDFVFDIDKDKLSFSGLLSLAQHHGFPTPLLDWSISPYVAAFFSFAGLREEEEHNSGKDVFIYVFDVDKWQTIMLGKNWTTF